MLDDKSRNKQILYIRMIFLCFSIKLFYDLFCFLEYFVYLCIVRKNIEIISRN